MEEGFKLSAGRVLEAKGRFLDRRSVFRGKVWAEDSNVRVSSTVAGN